MPNWCENELKVAGNKESINALLNLIKSDDLSFDFEKVIPHPEGIKHNSEEGYYFRVNNWGTKWRLEEDSISIDRESDQETCICFDTAWAPCLPIVTKLAELFPALKFKYTYGESGMDFSGFATFENGDLTDSGEGEYDDYTRDWYEEDEDEDDDQDEDIEEVKISGENEDAEIQTVASTEPGFSNTFDGSKWIITKKDDGTLKIEKYLGKDTSPVFPQGASEIGIGAFAGCSTLNSLAIPDGIKVIAAYSFEGSSLTSIVIPGSVELIGEGAFEGCKNLSSVILQEGIKCIDENAFNECSSLSSILIPGSVLELYEAFQWCTNLSSVIFEQAREDVEASIYIGGNVFNGCINLQSVRMQGSEYEIDGDMFEGCPNVVIHAPKGSSAIEYAKAQKIRFIDELREDGCDHL